MNVKLKTFFQNKANYVNIKRITIKIRMKKVINKMNYKKEQSAD